MIMVQKIFMNERTKEAYLQKAQAELKEIKARLTLLKARSENKGADVRIEAQKHLNGLNDKFGNMQRQLDMLENSAQEAWEDLITGIDNSIAELRKSVEDSFDRFGK
jgi:predicted translin family RNA/ssDNA-binding protein